MGWLRKPNEIHACELPSGGRGGDPTWTHTLAGSLWQCDDCQIVWRAEGRQPFVHWRSLTKRQARKILSTLTCVALALLLAAACGHDAPKITSGEVTKLRHVPLDVQTYVPPPMCVPTGKTVVCIPQPAQTDVDPEHWEVTIRSTVAGKKRAATWRIDERTFDDCHIGSEYTAGGRCR